MKTLKLDTDAECISACIIIKYLINVAKRENIDISKECEPIKDYNGSNKFLLDIKKECEEGGFI